MRSGEWLPLQMGAGTHLSHFCRQHRTGAPLRLFCRADDGSGELHRSGESRIEGMTDRSNPPLDFQGWTCPLPLRDYPTIVMGHGSGGKLMADLIEHLFAPQFSNEYLSQMGDATALNFQWQISNSQLAIDNCKLKIAFTTDSFVVRPLF